MPSTSSGRSCRSASSRRSSRPLLLCPDRRDGVLALYAARPITPLDYVGARWAAFLTVSRSPRPGSPRRVLFAWNALDASDPGSYLADDWDVVPRFLAAGALVAAVLTTLSLLISSFASRRAYAAVAMLAVVIVGSARRRDRGGELLRLGRGRRSPRRASRRRSSTRCTGSSATSVDRPLAGLGLRRSGWSA